MEKIKTKHVIWGIAALVIAVVAAIALFFTISQKDPTAFALGEGQVASSVEACAENACTDESCCADAEAADRKLHGQAAVEAGSCCADAEEAIRELGVANDA